MVCDCCLNPQYEFEYEVLILVFVEDGLRPCSYGFTYNEDEGVLILVFVEDGLRQEYEAFDGIVFES